MSHFTPVSALAGGVMIGVAAAGLWLLSGRIAGVSGVIGGALAGRAGWRWRVAFLAGLMVGGVVMAAVLPDRVAASPRGVGLLACAGLLVGVGTALSNGCTSGHGVCGVGRLSRRSMAATITFMLTGALAVAALRWWGA
jgi:uncharacterized membrane protein YedE/YeeE